MHIYIYIHTYAYIHIHIYIYIYRERDIERDTCIYSTTSTASTGVRRAAALMVIARITV